MMRMLQIMFSGLDLSCADHTAQTSNNGTWGTAVDNLDHDISEVCTIRIDSHEGSAPLKLVVPDCFG